MKISNYSVMHNQQYILKDLSVEFTPNRLNILMGENGAGKTTLFDSIAGVLHENKQPILDVSVAYKIQNPVLFSNLTVQEIINMFNVIGDDKLETESGRLIKEQCLRKIFHRKLGQLSGGELQLLFDYGTHLLDRDLYLFDEPTAGVSFSNSQLVLQMMQELVDERGKTVVTTLHDLREVNDLKAHIITLKDGKVSFSGTRDQLLTKDTVTNLKQEINPLI
ncbi:ABC transporter ATP-binding protein [Weissella hellenica]|nr:ABC transporter ATP-binding protein [Weissella hellenica]